MLDEGARRSISRGSRQGPQVSGARGLAGCSRKKSWAQGLRRSAFMIPRAAFSKRRFPGAGRPRAMTAGTYSPGAREARAEKLLWVKLPPSQQEPRPRQVAFSTSRSSR